MRDGSSVGRCIAAKSRRDKVPAFPGVILYHGQDGLRHSETVLIQPSDDLNACGLNAGAARKRRALVRSRHFALVDDNARASR